MGLYFYFSIFGLSPFVKASLLLGRMLCLVLTQPWYPEKLSSVPWDIWDIMCPDPIYCWTWRAQQGPLLNHPFAWRGLEAAELAKTCAVPLIKNTEKHFALKQAAAGTLRSSQLRGCQPDLLLESRCSAKRMQCGQGWGLFTWKTMVKLVREL